MCDQNALIRMLAAAQQQQQQQQQRAAVAAMSAFAGQTSSPNAAAAQMNALAAMANRGNPMMANNFSQEMLMWQMMQAQMMQQQMQQAQQQQQQQSSFDEALKKIMQPPAKNGTPNNGTHNGAPKQVTPQKSQASASAATPEQFAAAAAALRVAAAATPKGAGLLEPGEVVRKPVVETKSPAKPTSSSTSNQQAMRNMLDAAMWQMVATQLAQQQKSAKVSNSLSVPRSAEKPSTSSVLLTPTANDTSRGEGRSTTPSENGADVHRKRPPATEAQAKLPLQFGWRRQTCVRLVTASGVRGDVFYYAPCGKKLSTYAEVMRYLMKNGISVITRDNFSFSSKLVIGEFIVAKPKKDGIDGEKEFVRMTEEEMHEELAKLQKPVKPAPSIAEKKEKVVEKIAKEIAQQSQPEEILDNLNDEFDEAVDEEDRVKLSREPMDDLLLHEIRPIPDLPRIGNQCLGSTAFADALMVHEFVQNFAHVLNIDLDNVPPLEDLCAGIAGDSKHLPSVLDLTYSLCSLVLEYPGLPSGKSGKTKLGQSITEVGLRRENFSELLRLFLASRDKQGQELAVFLDSCSFETTSANAKASILAYLCNELLCCKNIVGEIDRNLDEITRLKGEKWMREGKARTLRTVQKKKQKSTAREEDEENESDSDGSRPPSPTAKKFTPGLGQCEILTHEEECMSVEELESLISELQTEAQIINKKIHNTTMRIRSFPFGWDRYHRQYWLLAHTPAVLIESIESAGPHNPACNAYDICAKDPASAPLDNFIDPDVIGCVEDLVDEVILTRAHADRKQRRRYRRIDNWAKRGWWTIDNKESLEHLKASLHGRGIRERCLHRLLCKNWFLKDIKFGTITASAVDEILSASTLDAISRHDVAKVVEELRARIISSGLNSTSADLVEQSSMNTDDVQQLRQQLLAVEQMVDPKFIRPSFNQGVRQKPDKLPILEEGEIRDGVDEDDEDDSKLMIDEDPATTEDTSSVEEPLEMCLKWRRYVSEEAKTNAQLMLAVQLLEASIAWERSPKEALCQICKSTDGDEMILCDGCETGYHLQCFRPEMTSVPSGDWFCPRCRYSKSNHPVCLLCCHEGDNLSTCQRCSNFFHLECAQEEADADFICSWCNEVKNSYFERRVILRGQSEEKQEAEEVVEGIETRDVKPEKKAPKRKAGEPMQLVLNNDMTVELCRLMLDEIEAQSTAGPFLEPVDVSSVPGYSDIIANPIDLHTIRLRVDSNFYDAHEDFAADMEQMFSNCRTFNEDDSPVGVAGITLAKFYHKRWRQLKYNFMKRLRRLRH